MICWYAICGIPHLLFPVSRYHATMTVLVLDILCSSYLSSGTPVISTVTPASGGTCVELSATRSKVPHHTYPWWGPPLESVGATSRILTPPGVGWRGCLWCSCYWYCYWLDSVFLLYCIPVIRTVMLASGTWCVEQSATWNKVPHHRYGGGHLLNPWGSPLESHIAGCWHDGGILSALVIQTQYMIHLITPMWQEHLLFRHSFG